MEVEKDLILNLFSLFLAWRQRLGAGEMESTTRRTLKTVFKVLQIYWKALSTAVICVLAPSLSQLLVLLSTDFSLTDLR